MQDKIKNRPIFIVGCERSGTTMLRLILSSHKNIAIPPQTKFFKKLYKRRLFFGDLSKQKNRHKLIKRFYDNHDRNTKIIDLGIDKTDIHCSLSKSSDTLGSFLSVIPKLYLQNHNKARWGDKHPYYIKYLPQLYKLFPDAQVIHIIRDGRDAVASLKRMPWWKQNSIFAMLNWQEAIKKGLVAKSKYNSDQFMEIRYEDLIDDPVKSVKSICSFLGEDYSDDLLKFQKLSKEAIPNYKMKWHSATKNEINSSSIGKWSKELEPWEIALLNKKFNKELILYDYDITNNVASISLKIYFRYLFTKIHYKYLQHGTVLVDKLLSVLYRWDLDYRN